MAVQPRKTTRRNERHTKAVNIALQGGGAHGAYTWGVLDQLFEDDRIWIEAISGTSAGAMNAVVAAQGMFENGAEGARARLREFWEAVSKSATFSPIQRSPLARATGSWSLASSPSYVMFDLMSRLVSPYDINPLDHNPLRDLVDELVDFEKVRACVDMGIF
ncbi:MAG: patatin-like phospholipase family protein, partial [Pseudomonadota bacterium]